MKEFLYEIMAFVSKVHEKILTLNDEYELFLSDKILHFIVIGMLGLGLVFWFSRFLSFWQKKDTLW